MGELTVYADLDVEAGNLAREAAAHISSIQQRLVTDIVEIGNTLLRVKAALDHGSFIPWLKAEFNWTGRTAQNYMSVAERFGSNPKPISHLPLATVYSLAAPSTPDDVRDKIVTRLAGGEVVDVGEIKAEIGDARRQAERERAARERLEKKSPEARKRAQAAFDRRMREVERRKAEAEERRSHQKAALAEAAALVVSALGEAEVERLLGLLDDGALVLSHHDFAEARKRLKGSA